jgi:HEAT repeats
MNRAQQLKILLIGFGLAFRTVSATHGQALDDDVHSIRPRVPLANTYAADLLIKKFYAAYPCMHPDLAVAMANGRPELARAIFDSDRPERDRYAAYVCLIAAKVRGYKDLIKRGLDDRAQEIRRCAVHQLPNAIPAEDLPGEYIRLLSDPWASMRYYGAEGLARYPSKDALELLLKLLADESVETRHLAVSTLLKWNNNDAKARLRELARNDNITVAGAAMSGLAQDPGYVLDLGILHSYLKQELDHLRGPPYSGTGIVLNLIGLAAKKGDATSLEVLEMASHHQHPSVRQSALRAIDEFKRRE